MAAATVSRGVTMQWLMEDKISPEAGISLARMTIASGVLSESHFHSNCSETIHVENGLIRQRIGEDWMTLRTGETCVIPRGTVHQTENIGIDEAILMVCYSSGSRIYEQAD